VIRFEINGRNVDPSNMEDALLAAVLVSVKENIHSKICSIKDPTTGESPVVTVKGKSLDDLKLYVSGSESICAVVKDRLGLELSTSIEERCVDDQPAVGKYVFLCYASEDFEIAEATVETLHKNGIEAFFYKLEGHDEPSFVRKISDALDRCTDFIAICSNSSINKHWVKFEIDTAIIQRQSRKVQITLILVDLTPDNLPSVYQGLHLRPWNENFSVLDNIVSDVLGISKKPDLEALPSVVEYKVFESMLSPAATSIVKMIIEQSETGYGVDMQLSPSDIRARINISDDDIIDAVDELEGQEYIKKLASFGCGAIGFDRIIPEPTMFVDFDSLFTPWNPEDDALRIAQKIAVENRDSYNVKELADLFGWECRRMNPAVNFLVERKLVGTSDSISYPWSTLWIRKLPATRRFVRDRTLA